MFLPIKTSIVISSRLLLLYIFNLFFNGIILLPSIIVYGIMTLSPYYFYIFSIITILFVPVLPMIGATIIGTIITIISSRFRHSNYIFFLLSISLVVGILLLCGRLTLVTTTELSSLGKQLLGMIYKVYSLAILYTNGI